MTRAITATAIVLLGVSLPGAQSAVEIAARLKLKVSTHSGPTPLELDLTGSLAGVPADLLSACVLQVDQALQGRHGLEILKRSTSSCFEGLGLSESRHTFSRKLQLVETGVYIYRILIKTEDRQIAGMEQQVKVFVPLDMRLRPDIPVVFENPDIAMTMEPESP